MLPPTPTTTGFVSLMEGWYMVLVTKKKMVALVAAHIIYKVGSRSGGGGVKCNEGVNVGSDEDEHDDGDSEDADDDGFVDHSNDNDPIDRRYKHAVYSFKQKIHPP